MVDKYKSLDQFGTEEVVDLRSIVQMRKSSDSQPLTSVCWWCTCGEYCKSSDSPIGTGYVATSSAASAFRRLSQRSSVC